MLHNTIAIAHVNNFVIGARAWHAHRLGHMKRKPLSAADIEAARALRRLWDDKKTALKLTQDKAAELLGFSTQGAVSHYLNGYTPLNTDAVLKFAALLQVQPSAIRPDIEDLIGTVAPSGLSQIGRDFVAWLSDQCNSGALNDADLLVLRGRAEQMAESRAQAQPIKSISVSDRRQRQVNFKGPDRRYNKESGYE